LDTEAETHSLETGNTA